MNEVGVYTGTNPVLTTIFNHFKTLFMKEPHKCKYCGVETTQPDDECYAKPETLESAAKKYSGLAYDRNDYEEKYYNQQGCTKYDAFIKGAKWQAERMYSEEEVLELLRKAHFVEQNIEEWFQPFKKKTQ